MSRPVDESRTGGYNRPNERRIRRPDHRPPDAQYAHKRDRVGRWAGHDDIGGGDQVWPIVLSEIPDHVHTCSGALREASAHDRGAVCTGPDEDELCPAPQPHHGERGGQLLGVRLVVERTRGDDGRKTGQAHQRTGGHGV
jgi:hypothetical protein